VTFVGPFVTFLTFTIANPNAADSLVGLAFFDVLPSGLVVNTPNNLTNTCSGTPFAPPLSSQISLVGGSVAGSGSCTVSVVVTGFAAGTYTDVTGPVSSTNSGTGNSAAATLEVSPLTSAVPEPGTIFLFASGLGVLGLLRKRLPIACDSRSDVNGHLIVPARFLK
jgi:hypothetical protein